MKSSVFYFKLILSMSRWAEAAAEVEPAQVKPALTAGDFPLFSSGKHRTLSSAACDRYCGHRFLLGVKL